MDCPHCQSRQVVKNGRETLSDGVLLQRYRCNDCGKRFNERTGTPMARLRAPRSVATALHSRTEEMGAPATGRTFGKSHSTILRWEEPLYRLILDGKPSPSPRSSAVKLLKPEDFEQWDPLNRAYMQEGGFPIQGSLEERRAGFETSTREERCWWVLWENDTLVAISALNAIYETTGQIGGVYVLPERRRCGLATRLMQGLICDCIQVHGLQKLILFTGDTNLAAQRLYESLGFRQIGNFALLFGTPQDSEA
jgi:transposase-like protein/GNAT superfamily N-acetyltransferase